MSHIKHISEVEMWESEVYRMINYKMVSHPSHYNLEGKKECIEQMRADYGETITAIFCLTNAYKYLYRAGNKGSREEDIAKAKWYWEYFKDIEDKVVFDRYLNRLVEKIEEVLECEDR